LTYAKDAKEYFTFSTKNPEADFYAYNIRKDGHETLFSVKCADFDEEFVLTMPGLFNVENALGVIAAATKLGIPREYIHSGLERARSSGRMELYASRDKTKIAIVDYAHNKLSFEKLFSSMKEEYPDYGIVSIFGCPGKKALIRRRDLGTVAGQYAKKVYLVAEDPGYEPVADISADIAQYVKAQNCPYEMIEDRGEAIKDAIESSEGKTLFLITGKGAETRQKYGSDYLDCPSDVDYVKKYLAEYDERAEK
ncbi:MAG TPA: UDP-N-acetylmuramoyl-L-alanyl-D-glutamate--2,6-diaminopimelate ligase, partial [Lachnoclostridium phocaeense]|nr:UDP-N-acetylmuramoyl-L-alanyl-D-glutamate--2,6-diaminopimelate ligase [Lachnoclostridium phocaeense]